MTAKRIIPCLDVRNGRVVKGQKFKDIRDIADPVEMARFYNGEGADALVFYDIAASVEGRMLFTDMLQAVAAQISIPLIVGGGIATTADCERVIQCGADQISINSGAIRSPELISEAAQKYGKQRIILSMDVKRINGEFHVFTKGGKEDTGMNALKWAEEGVQRGAGELVINSIDTDGVREGFDIEMLLAIASRVQVPIIASGGAGKAEDFQEIFKYPQIDAGLAAGIFHTKELRIPALKEYLKEKNIEVY